MITCKKIGSEICENIILSKLGCIRMACFTIKLIYPESVRMQCMYIYYQENKSILYTTTIHTKHFLSYMFLSTETLTINFRLT